MLYQTIISPKDKTRPVMQSDTNHFTLVAIWNQNIMFYLEKGIKQYLIYDVSQMYLIPTFFLLNQMYNTQVCMFITIILIEFDNGQTPLASSVYIFIYSFKLRFFFSHYLSQSKFSRWQVPIFIRYIGIHPPLILQIEIYVYCADICKKLCKFYSTKIQLFRHICTTITVFCPQSNSC